MKRITFLTLALIACFALSLQAQNKPLYANVAFHKLKPGHTLDEAMAIEKKWKTIHKIRREAGLISGWSVYTLSMDIKLQVLILTTFQLISLQISIRLDNIPWINMRH